MRTPISILFFTAASTTLLGLSMIMSTDAAAYLLAQEAIGADTPISGITVGVIGMGIVTGFGGLLWTVRLVFKFGGQVALWIQTVEKAAKIAEIVDRLEERMGERERQAADTQREVDALQRWRIHLVDPSLVRSGATMRQDLLDEAAG